MIGWYVHHHGSGHLQRLVAVSRHLRTPVTALSSAARPAGFDGDWVRLERDDTEPVDTASASAGGALHWVPLHHRGLRERGAAITSWIAQAAPQLFVTDVSVEVTSLARLCGVPVVVVAMLGDRDDPAHRLGRNLAQALLAPWPAAGGELGTEVGSGSGPPVIHVGAFSRFDGRAAAPDAARPGTVLVLWGSGGRDVDDADFRAAGEATPGWTWEYRVPGSDLDGSGRRGSGQGGTGSSGADDVWDALQRAEVVVVHGGHNAVAEVAAARRAAVVIAQERPFDEQRQRAKRLRALGLVALDGWPPAAHWPELLARARGIGASPWQQWAPGDGAQRAAAFLDEMATPAGYRA